MGQALKIQYLSVDEYLTGELIADVRHEYVDGEVFAMAGASERHNRATLNIAFQLRAAVRGTSCGVFVNDMKIRIRQGNRFYYPDVSMCCDRNDTNAYFKDHPCLIAEVLSHSTAKIDRREKWLAYREIPQLRYYLLISTRQPKVEYFQRNDNGEWETGQLESGEALEISCNEQRIKLRLEDIFEDVSW
jgi:Uma2 family endonuclease